MVIIIELSACIALMKVCNTYSKAIVKSVYTMYILRCAKNSIFSFRPHTMMRCIHLWANEKRESPSSPPFSQSKFFTHQLRRRRLRISRFSHPPHPLFSSILFILVDCLLIRRSQYFDSSCTINRHVETCREALAAALCDVRLRKPHIMDLM